jgi:hypothetical protein
MRPCKALDRIEHDPRRAVGVDVYVHVKPCSLCQLDLLLDVVLAERHMAVFVPGRAALEGLQQQQRAAAEGRPVGPLLQPR